MKALGRLFWFAAAVLVFCFALLSVNQSQVALEFLSWRTPEVSVFWWLLLAFVAGAALGGLAFAAANLRMRMRQRSLNRELAASQHEVEKLRNLTFQD